MILDLVQQRKRLFNVKEEKDITTYKKFLATGAWGRNGCPFFLVFPIVAINNLQETK